MSKSEQFLRLMRKVKKDYTGREVPPEQRSKYGKFYDEKESERIAFAVAKKLGWNV